MLDVLSFERQKEFLKKFIENIVIDPEWFEIHYVLPSGMGVDHLLFGGSGGDDDGNGREPDGGGNGAGGNGNGKKSEPPLDLSSLNKIRTCGSGVSDENPSEISVSDFCGHDDNTPRCGVYRKNGKGGGATATTSENAKSKNPQETKPISAIAKQQSASHLSSYGKNGEGGIRTHGEISPTHALQACTFDLSVTSPNAVIL